MSPNPVPGYDGNQTVFIYGSGFVNGNGLKVHVTWPNGQGDLTGTQVSFVSSSQLSIRINVGTVAANWTARVINPDGSQSNIFNFSVTVQGPTITSMSPNPVPEFNGDQTVYINGSGFVSGNGLKVHVTWPNGQGDLTGTQVSFVSSSQLSIRINVGTAAANWTARVINPDGSQSNIFNFSVTVQGPTITSISPNPVPGFDGDQTVYINGSGFVNGNGLKVHVTWPNGQGDLTGTQVSFVSSSQLSIRINVGTVAANWTARVINPDGSQSNIFNFSVTVQGPTITSMSPNPVPGFDGDQTVYINGSGFVNGNGLKVHVTWPNGQGDLTGSQVSFVSSSQLSIRINTGTTAANWTARVINPDGSQSNIFNFSVTVQGLTITSMNPNPVPGFNGDQTVYINGSGFVSGNGLKVHVTWPNGQGDLTGSQVSFVSSNQLSIRINVGTVAANWTARVINPDGGQSNIFNFSVTVQGLTITSMNPNPVPGHNGDQPVNLYGSGYQSGNGLKVHVTWLTGSTDLSGSQVSFVSSSQITMQINVGTAPGNWAAQVINPDGGKSNVFPFTVSGGKSGDPSGTLTANPATCQVKTENGTCSISLVWSLTNITTGQISVTDVLGNQQVVGVVGGTSGTQQIPWLQALPQKYAFYLWDYSKGTRGAQLASVSVAATGPSGSSGSPSVLVKPERYTRGFTFLIFGSNLAAGAATVYIQPPNGTQTIAGQVSIGTDGGFSFSYATQETSVPGAYLAWAIDKSGAKSSTGSFTLFSPTKESLPNCQSNTTSGCHGDPINTATGNYTYQHTDLTIAGRGMPFAFTRTYNSQNGTPGPMGAGWSHSYMASFVQNVDHSITIRTPDGQLLIFDPVGDSYVSRFNNVYSTLQSSSGNFVLTTKNQMSYRFSGSQLTALSDRNGNTIQLTYSDGVLTGIIDTVGRRLAVSTDPLGRITRIVDPAGRSLQYYYNGAGDLVAFTDANGGLFAYSYDGLHQMLTAFDPQNNTFLTNTYDSVGRVSSQTDGMRNRWTYVYDSGSLVTTITDPNGKISTHLHDSKFELMRVTDTFGKNEQYQYDALGSRISIQDRNGNMSRFNYDLNGNVIAATDPQSNVQAAAYDPQSNLLSKTDALGNQSTFTYDSKGNLIAAIDSLGNKTVFAYDSNGQLTAKTDAQGRTTQYAYDGSSNLTQVVDPLGKKTTYAYDAVGRRTSTTDANGFTATTAYDANNNVVKVTDPLGNATQYTYDGNNNRVKVIDPRGKVTTYAYDGNYKLVATTDAMGNKVSKTYDRLRNLASVTDQRGNTMRYTYDSENRVTSTTDPLGNTTTYAYDASGNRTKVTDALGNATTYTYDSLNRLVSTKDALGNTVGSAFDSAGRLIKKTDQVGNVTTYNYDALGRQISVVDAAGGVVAFQYDKVGNRVQITDARGKVTQFTYDGMNRLLTTTDPLGNTTANQYDTVGNLARTTDGNGNSKSYEYDADRRPIKVSYSTGGSIQFTFDPSGNRTQMVDLVGTSKYVYDDLNRLQNYTSPASATVAYSYDSASNRTALQYPGGKSVQYTYDADNRISRVTDWNSFAATYSYDAAGRISGVKYSNGLSSQFAYDALAQSLKIQHANGVNVIYSEATAWSANGNPTSSDISGLTAPGLPSESTAYVYNDANELAGSTYGSPVSDKNGNLTIQPSFGDATTFTYDLNNRATAISGSSVNAAIRYFGDGKLAEFDSAGSSHRYLIDPAASVNRILAEIDPGGAMQVAYVYGPRGMISQILGGQTYAYFHNLQGSTVAVLDSSGSVKNSYRYDPFGQKLSSSAEQVSNSFTFMGKFAVPTFGAFSATSFRLYDSRSGRFTAVDPLYPADVVRSPYLYGLQSPISQADPSGLISQVISTGVNSTTSLSTPASILTVAVPSGSGFTGPTTFSAGLDTTLNAPFAGWLIIPQYGNFCGPNWTAPNSAPAASSLDAACRAHDRAYDFANTVSDREKATAIRNQADLTLGAAALEAFLNGTGTSYGDTYALTSSIWFPLQSGGRSFYVNVILDFPQNTKTVWDATKSGASAVSNWLGSLW